MLTKTEWCWIFLVILSFMVSFLIYPSLSDTVTIHWDIQGNANGYSSKLFAVLLPPFTIASLVLLFLILPRLPSSRKAIQGFRKTYDLLISVILLILAAVFTFVFLWNQGITPDTSLIMTFVFSSLSLTLGFAFKHIQQNPFIGIRTPWTLKSRKVWDKTHRLGGSLFKIGSILSFLILLIEKYGLYIIIAYFIVISIILIIYSYIIYRKETTFKRHKLI